MFSNLKFANTVYIVAYDDRFDGHSIIPGGGAMREPCIKDNSPVNTISYWLRTGEFK